MVDQRTVELELVENALEVRENIRRFHRDLPNHHERALQLAVQTSYWVYDPESDAFGPSKFVGFKRMSFTDYILADNNRSTGQRFDGHVTQRAITSVAGEYQAFPQFASQLQEWLTSTFGRDAVAGINPDKWAFVDLQSKIRYWAVCCQPETYDARSALAHLADMCWTLDRGEPQPGDKMIVWQAKGQRGRRGVIGLGEVIEKPGMREESPAELAFWLIPPPTGPEKRTRFRILRYPGLPLWESDHMELLSNLSVARARGGTVFNVTATQWAQVLQLAEQASAQSPMLDEQSRSGQGFGLSAAERSAVELHAQTLAEEYFREAKYEVIPVFQTNCYDLHCTRGEETLHVEVKGTTGGGNSIFLTANEVDLATRCPASAVLFFVRNIRLRDTASGPVAEGGDPLIFKPWDITAGNLKPLQYEFTLPGLP